MIWKRNPKRKKALWTQLDGGVKPNGFENLRRSPGRRLASRSLQSGPRWKLYRERSTIYLKRWRHCAVFTKRLANQIHHKFGKIGKLLLWEPGWRPVSLAGHQWIDAHREEARKRGLLAPIGSWNDYRKAVRIERISLGNFLKEHENGRKTRL